MNNKYLKQLLFLLCFNGTTLCREIFAQETFYYTVLVKEEVRQAVVTISRSAEEKDTASVTTEIDGLGRLTYTYEPVFNSNSDYILTINEPNYLPGYKVHARELAATSQYFYENDFSNGHYVWLVDSPAISIDGISLQLPVFNINSATIQTSGSTHSHLFLGTIAELSYFNSNRTTGEVQLLTDDDFYLVQLSFSDFRMTHIWKPVKVSSDSLCFRKGLESISSDDLSDSDSCESSVHSTNPGKKEEDDDDPDVAALNSICRGITAMSVLLPDNSGFKPLSALAKSSKFEASLKTHCPLNKQHQESVINSIVMTFMFKALYRLSY
ncbi:hypothetical protein GZ77_15935 [Endozoicomonas montiporae]|uniref:Uncharacterized protein n=2 Tax=Endozoicomonas montiporae TaxID=1027273 RepID=A0A081N5Q3_9GAMM|nr:hypothetical protein [Endozoicomonas montiporae]AMO57330.1 hypothetical protein EZMO1_3335 [Endozoicomonas montiporae CL-33]KEQ13776.1 hypothetical protein GZ77_15935 [Endozoicomonas montiporae]